MFSKLIYVTTISVVIIFLLNGCTKCNRCTESKTNRDIEAQSSTKENYYPFRSIEKMVFWDSLHSDTLKFERIEASDYKIFSDPPCYVYNGHKVTYTCAKSQDTILCNTQGLIQINNEPNGLDTNRLYSYQTANDVVKSYGINKSVWMSKDKGIVRWYYNAVLKSDKNMYWVRMF